MTKSSRSELLQTLQELSTVFPEWRFGQLVANVATAARGAQAEAVWECEDHELITAAKRLLERNQNRVEIPA